LDNFTTLDLEEVKMTPFQLLSQNNVSQNDKKIVVIELINVEI